MSSATDSHGKQRQKDRKKMTDKYTESIQVMRVRERERERERDLNLKLETNYFGDEERMARRHKQRVKE